MSAQANVGGSSDSGAVRSRPERGASSLLWIALLVLVFVAALGGSYVLLRGRTSTTAQPVTAPTTTVVVATTASASTAPTAAPTRATAASQPAAASQPTLTADQAQAAYLWQQAHEQDMCSCNTANPPSSP
jgi:hypothetical protein